MAVKEMTIDLRHTVGGVELYAKAAEYDSDGNKISDSLASKQDNLTFNGTYDSSTNPAATVSTVTSAVSGKEDASNKVTTIRDASTATDTAYPSEKAVATALAGFSGCTVRYTAGTGELHLDFSGS